MNACIEAENIIDLRKHLIFSAGQSSFLAMLKAMLGHSACVPLPNLPTLGQIGTQIPYPRQEYPNPLYALIN
jgi:hypothetical protein